MSLSPIGYLLWVASGMLLALIVWALIRRALVREVPVFSLYVVFQLFRCLGLAVVYRMGRIEYFYSYWTAQTISAVLGFAVLYELYRKMFRSYDAIRQLGATLFAGAAVMLLAAAVLTTAFAPGADAAGVVKSVVLLERSVRVMQCGLLLFLFLLSFHFGLAWRNYLFGIALGFGIFASVELMAIALRSQLGGVAAGALALANSAAYDCGLVIWVCYLLAPEPAPQYRGVVQHNDLEKWNQALLEILQR